MAYFMLGLRLNVCFIITLNQFPDIFKVKYTLCQFLCSNCIWKDHPSLCIKSKINWNNFSFTLNCWNEIICEQGQLVLGLLLPELSLGVKLVSIVFVFQTFNYASTQFCKYTNRTHFGSTNYLVVIAALQISRVYLLVTGLSLARFPVCLFLQ